uniref:helicase-related protein n=1 Tax=Gemmiger sp. TaxID=2049027 RepID=UPI003FF08468
EGAFNVYDDVREKLVARGVPREEVAFIHEYNTETKKAELFAKVRAGQVRILMGSTPKLGAGTNIQDRLIALHHLDCPWKPSDLEHQEGRILRQGNCTVLCRNQGTGNGQSLHQGKDGFGYSGQ